MDFTQAITVFIVKDFAQVGLDGEGGGGGGVCSSKYQLAPESSEIATQGAVS